MLGALPEYRSITSDINSSILANRLRALFAFITTPLVVAFSEREQVFGRWKYTTKTIKTIRPSSASCRFVHDAEDGLICFICFWVYFQRPKTSFRTLEVYHKNDKNDQTIFGIVNEPA